MSAANPYATSFGNIPWGTSGASMFSALGGSPQQAMAALGPAYQGSYNDYINFAKSQGQMVDSLYNTTMQQQLENQQSILGALAGYGQSRSNELVAGNTADKTNAQQSMIGRGLGNWTVLDRSNMGYENLLAQQQTQLKDSITGMRTDLMNQFGQQNTNLSLQHANFLERLAATPPNAGMYGDLARMFGAAGQSQRDQNQIQGQLRGLGGGMMQAPGGIGAGGQGRMQSSFNPYWGNDAMLPSVGGGPGWNSNWYAQAATSNPFAGMPSLQQQLASANQGGYYDDGAYGWAAGPNPPTDYSSDGYGWEGNDLVYNPSQDFSDGQWAGADWLYID